MQKLEQNYNVVNDDVYGFDLAVYPKQNNGKHVHSIALVKRINEEDKMRDIEKWVKICHSVKKQLWIEFEGKIQKIKLSSL